MRPFLYCAVGVAAAVIGTAAASAAPRHPGEDPNLPGVRITITKRSYLDPGRQVPARTQAYYDSSPLYGAYNTPIYQGVVGLPHHLDPLYVPGIRPLAVDFRAPDALMGDIHEPDPWR
jgi:hypothetical protein